MLVTCDNYGNPFDIDTLRHSVTGLLYRLLLLVLVTCTDSGNPSDSDTLRHSVTGLLYRLFLLVLVTYHGSILGLVTEMGTASGQIEMDPHSLYLYTLTRSETSASETEWCSCLFRLLPSLWW